MPTKTVILIGLGALVLGAAFGRWVAPTKTIVKTQVIEKQVQHVVDHTITVTKTVKEPDGAVETTITKRNDVRSADILHVDTNSEKVVEHAQPSVLLSAIAESRVLRGTPGPVYGGQIQYRVFGPIFVGAIGTSDGTVGVSLGIQL